MALRSLRNAANSWVFKGLMVLLAFTFAAFFGVSGDPFTRTTAPITVGGTDIDAKTIQRAFEEQRRRISQTLNQAITAEQAQRFGLVDNTVNGLITEEVLDRAGRNAGLAASDAMISRAIRESPQFRPGNGPFDPYAFAEFLSSQGMSEAEFVVLMRKQIVQSQLLQAAGVGATVPNAAIELLYRYRTEKRVAVVATVRGDTAGEEAVPDEAAQQAYYDANKSRFMAPAMRAATVAFLSPEKFAEEIAISEADIAAAYVSEKGRYETPENRSLVQAVVPIERKADAERLVKLVADGATFAAAAKEITGAQPVELGTLTRADFAVEALIDAAFNTSEGAVSAPVPSALGWHVLYVKAITPGTTKSLDELRDPIKRDLALRRARETIFKLGNSVEDTLAGGATIEKAAEVHHLEVVKIARVAQDGTTQDGTPITGLPVLRNVLQSIYATQVGRDSDLTETPDGGFYVLRVDSVTPPTQKPLDQVRAEVTRGWQGEQRRARAETVAKQILARVEAGEELSVVAPALGAQFQTTQPFPRSGGGAGIALGTDMAAQLFRAKPRDVVLAPSGETYQVARLISIERAVPNVADAAFKQAADALKSAVANDLETALADAMRAGISVSVDQTAIDKLFAQ